MTVPEAGVAGEVPDVSFHPVEVRMARSLLGRQERVDQYPLAQVLQ
jgi:hypothetical protein